MTEDARERADEVLVAEAKAGRIDAYAELVRRTQEKIYRTIFGMTRNHEDTDDLIQETFMYAYKAIKGFEQKSSFYTWVYRIAVNLTLNFLKKRGRQKGRQEFDDNLAGLDLAASGASSPEGDSLQRELREKLDEAIRRLPLGYRAAFNLVTIQGMSHGRAAEILGCSENTVSWRMHKARKMLQERLKPYLQAVSHEM